MLDLSKKAISRNRFGAVLVLNQVRPASEYQKSEHQYHQDSKMIYVNRWTWVSHTGQNDGLLNARYSRTMTGLSGVIRSLLGRYTLYTQNRDAD
jgi:hypothetical protein